MPWISIDCASPRIPAMCSLTKLLRSKSSQSSSLWPSTRPSTLKSEWLPFPSSFGPLVRTLLSGNSWPTWPGSNSHERSTPLSTRLSRASQLSSDPLITSAGRRKNPCDFKQNSYTIRTLQHMDYTLYVYGHPAKCQKIDATSPTQENVSTSARKISVLSKIVTFFPLVNSFHHFKQLITLVFTFFWNSEFFTLKLKGITFNVTI